MAILVSGRETTDGPADAPRARHTVSKVRANGKACSAVDSAWHVRICRLTLLAEAGRSFDLRRYLLLQWARSRLSTELASTRRAQVEKMEA